MADIKQAKLSEGDYFVVQYKIKFGIIIIILRNIRITSLWVSLQALRKALLCPELWMCQLYDFLSKLLPWYICQLERCKCWRSLSIFSIMDCKWSLPTMTRRPTLYLESTLWFASSSWLSWPYSMQSTGPPCRSVVERGRGLLLLLNLWKIWTTLSLELTTLFYCTNGTIYLIHIIQSTVIPFIVINAKKPFH